MLKENKPIKVYKCNKCGTITVGKDRCRVCRAIGKPFAKVYIGIKPEDSYIIMYDGELISCIEIEREHWTTEMRNGNENMEFGFMENMIYFSYYDRTYLFELEYVGLNGRYNK